MATLSSLLGSNFSGQIGATGPTGATGPGPGARVGATGSAATITPDATNFDTYVVNGLGVPANIATPSGTPTDGQRLVLRFIDNGTGRALTWTGATGAYRGVGITLPSTTLASKYLYVGCVYNSAAGFWDAISTVQE